MSRETFRTGPREYPHRGNDRKTGTKKIVGSMKDIPAAVAKTDSSRHIARDC